MARGSKVVFGLGMVVFGLLVFMFASAYLIERELPKWLAASVGALAFPVLPVLWHVIGERRRRARLAEAKSQPKHALASGDRYVLRAVVVAAMVLVPMFVVGRTAVLRAAWDHKAWFIPDEPYDSIGGIEDMLAHVPADAEAVLVLRDHDKAKEAVIGYGNHQLVMFESKNPDKHRDESKALEQLNKQRDKVPFVKIEELSRVQLGGTNAMVTRGWASAIRSEGAGPRAAIKNELSKAPSDALIALAYVPATPNMGIEKAHGWLLQKAVNEKLTVEAQLDATDAAAAEKAVELLRAAWKKQISDVPSECRDEIAKLSDRVELERKGATISLHVDVQPEQLFGIMMCGMKGADFESD